MSTLPDLAALERGAFRNLFSDGLFDIALGVWLLAWSMLILAGNVVLGAFLMVALLPIWERTRRRVTLPRLGEVRFRSRSRNVRVGVMILLALVLLGLGALLAVTRGSGPRSVEDYFAATPQLLLAIPLALLLAGLAALFRLPRLLAHAAILLALLAFGHRIALGFPYSMTAAGLAVLTIGIAVLVRFLRRHPAEAAAYDAG